MDTERPQRVDHRVRDGRYGAGRARFARAFYAERIAGRRDRTVVEPDLGHAVGTRHFVIHERAVEKLARGRVVDRMLDRKSTRLNSSHRTISYAVFCLKKKTSDNVIGTMIP